MATIDYHRHVPQGASRSPGTGLAGPAALYDKFAALIGRYRSNIARRRKIHDLQDMDERMLADIGLSQADIHAALELPFEKDPTAFLAARRRERVGRFYRGVRRR